MRINADLYQLCSRWSDRVTTSPSVHGQLRVCSQGSSYRSCLTLLFTITAMLVAVLVAWAEPRRELRDCATCPVLIEVPAGTFVRMDKLGGPSFPVHFEKSYAIGKYEVTRAEFAAFVQATGQGKLQVFPQSQTKFFYKVVDAQVSFVEEDGKITKMILHQAGNHEAKRLP